MQTEKLNIANLELGFRLYSVHRATALLGIGREKLLTLIANGEISTVNVLGRLKISCTELLRFINQNNKPIPSVLIATIDSKRKSTRATKIDSSKIDEIFNNIKMEVAANEKTKEKNVS